MQYLSKSELQLHYGDFRQATFFVPFSTFVAKTFAVGKPTAVQITREFCSEMLRLAPRYIHFPRSRRETAEVIEQFEVFCQCRILQVLGALDGTHIPIVAPNVDG